EIPLAHQIQALSVSRRRPASIASSPIATHAAEDCQRSRPPPGCIVTSFALESLNSWTQRRVLPAGPLGGLAQGSGVEGAMAEESSPTHDVFLSYSSKDKAWADAAQPDPCADLLRSRQRIGAGPSRSRAGDQPGDERPAGAHRERPPRRG